jgi:hypothetical protein
MIKKVWKKVFLEFGENIRVFRALSELKKIRENRDDSPSESSLIIFSKDRPLQLEALLESKEHFVEEKVSTYIIYNACDPKFEDAYRDVFKRFDGEIEGVWDDSAGFKSILLTVLNKVSTKRLFFLVDDIIFKKRVSLQSFLSLDKSHIPSLRLGKHLKRCYTLNIDQSLPSFQDQKELLSWSYKDGEGDWAYPLSVDGHFFFTDEIKLMTETLDFKAPNSYEGKLQKFKRAYQGSIGVCEPISSIVNIPCNKVQTENDNHAGNLSADELLSYFWDKKIDIEKFTDLENLSCHQELPLTFIERSKS